MQRFRWRNSIPFFFIPGLPSGSCKPESAFSAEHDRIAVENSLQENRASHPAVFLNNPRAVTRIDCPIREWIALELPPKNRKGIHPDQTGPRTRVDNNATFNK